MCEQCNETLNRFISIHLECDLNILVNFDFTEMGKIYKKDCDRLPIINAIYCVLYSKHFQIDGCLMKSNIFSITSGDTLNTYNSSFGKGPAGRRARQLIETFEDQQLEKQLKEFKHRYHTVGNFMPLPMKSINRVTLNTARNTAFNDYADLFLELIKEYYSVNLNEAVFLSRFANSHQRKGVQNLSRVMVINQDYFESFADFNEFLKVNYLHPFYTNSRMPLFTHSHDEIYFKDIRDIKKYLENSLSIIEERGQAIVQALYDELLK